MNELINTEAMGETMELVAETTAKYGTKHMVIGIAAGFVAGMATTKVGKLVCRKWSDRKAEKEAARFHRVDKKTEEDGDVEVVSEQ